MELHNSAKIIPVMSLDQYTDLKNDIAQNGLLNPIVTFNGSILDGWHRYKACRELEIEPSFTPYEGSDPETFVIAMNIHRRHMTHGELATFAAKYILPIEKEKARSRMGQGGPGRSTPAVPKELQGESTKITGQKIGVGGRAVWMADRLRENAPALFKKVENNELGLYPAYDIFIKRQTEARTEVERSKKRKEKLDQMDRGVKAFLDHMRDWKVALADAILLKEANRFSPEGYALACRRLNEIKSMMDEFAED